MTRRMSDEEIADIVHNKIFGDLDGIESHALFESGPDEGLVEGEVPNAEPQEHVSGGVKITVEPMMANAQEGRKPSDTNVPGAEGDEDEKEEDHLKGIGGMSPLMARLHGNR